MTDQISDETRAYLASLGRKGGSVKSKAKTAAARRNAPKPKLTKAQRRYAKTAKGTLAEIAAELNVSQSLISLIRAGKR